MSQNLDQHLIDKAIKGDADAFVGLVDRYKYMVYTLAFRILKNREEAEEVAQDTFLKIYNSLSSFKGDSKFSTWVYKIVYHQSLDCLKRRKNTLRTENIDDFNKSKISLHENSLSQLEQKEQNAKIKNAVDELPGDDGILITLYYYEEFSLNEIAKIMTIPANTVKVKLFRARKKLAEILEYRLTPEMISSYGAKKG